MFFNIFLEVLKRFSYCSLEDINVFHGLLVFRFSRGYSNIISCFCCGFPADVDALFL